MEKADDIWTGGSIMTMDPDKPHAEAIAIAGGQILAVGSADDIAELVGPETVVHQLEGEFVMPGLIESHSHGLWGACRDLFDVYVGYEASLAELLDSIRKKTENVAPGSLIFGGPWRPDMRQLMGEEPRRILDEITPDHPVALQDVTQHSLWCNSLALKLAGITATSGEIKGGVIHRHRDTGEPTGILAETACAPVKALAERSEDQLAQACRHLVQHFNSLGITAFKEPMAFESDLAAYKAHDERGELTLHMAAHIVRFSPYSEHPTPYEEMERLRDVYRSENLRTDFAKLFLDGVAPSFTASFIQPYLESAGYDAKAHDPEQMLLISRQDMADTISELDRRGFLVKTHAVGDYAVRVTLDAIEQATIRCYQDENLRSTKVTEHAWSWTSANLASAASVIARRMLLRSTHPDTTTDW